MLPIEGASGTPSNRQAIKTNDDSGVTLSADGNTAFVADLNAGLQIIDISNPTSLSLTGTLNTSMAYDVSPINGGTDSEEERIGLQIIQADHFIPSLSSTLNTSGWAYAVTLPCWQHCHLADGSKPGLSDHQMSATLQAHH